MEPSGLLELACVACETACDAGLLSELLVQAKMSFETYPSCCCSRRVVLCVWLRLTAWDLPGPRAYLDYDSRLDEDVLVGEYDGATRHDVRREVAIPELVDGASTDDGDSLEVPWHACASSMDAVTMACWMRTPRVM